MKHLKSIKDFEKLMEKAPDKKSSTASGPVNKNELKNELKKLKDELLNIKKYKNVSFWPSQQDINNVSRLNAPANNKVKEIENRIKEIEKELN